MSAVRQWMVNRPRAIRRERQPMVVGGPPQIARRAVGDDGRRLSAAQSSRERPNRRDGQWEKPRAKRRTIPSPSLGRGERLVGIRDRRADLARRPAAPQSQTCRRVRGARRAWRYRRGQGYRRGPLLSRHALSLAVRAQDRGALPLFLGSVSLADKPALAVDLTNPDIPLGENDKLTRDTIFLERMKFLWKAVCYERVKVRNYGPVARRLRIDFVFGTDFRDLFEVRGTPRARRGRDLPPIVSRDRVAFRYIGLDEIERRTVLCFTPRRSGSTRASRRSSSSWRRASRNPCSSPSPARKARRTRSAISS